MKPQLILLLSFPLDVSTPSSSVGTPSINATLAVNFCGNPTLRTKAYKAKGKESLDVAFMQELWLPVMYPPHSKRIDISVGHKELTGIETFAHLYFNLDDVISMSGDRGEKAKAKHYSGPPLEWHNLYGCRCSKPQGNKIIALQNKYPRLVSSSSSSYCAASTTILSLGESEWR